MQSGGQLIYSMTTLNAQQSNTVHDTVNMNKFTIQWMNNTATPSSGPSATPAPVPTTATTTTTTTTTTMTTTTTTTKTSTIPKAIPTTTEEFFITSVTIQTTISDPQDDLTLAKKELSAIKKSSNSSEPTEDSKSADTTSLWAETFDYSKSQACGVAYVDISGHCSWAYSVINKDCTLHGYGFAHELGHNFGNRNNIELYDSRELENHIEYGHGLLIAEDPSVTSRNPRWDGYHTIIAYQKQYYYNPLNCWSNPKSSFTYKGVKYVAGDARYANAAG